MMKFFTARLLLILLVAALTACAHDPEKQNQARFYTQMGISNLVTNNCTEALRYLLEAEKREPNNSELQNALGLAYYCKNEYNLAVEAYKRAVELRPDFSEAWNNLGAAYAAVGKYDLAIAAFDKALADLLYNTPERAWLNKGDAYLARQDFDGAMTSFEKAVSVALPKAGSRDVVCVARNNIGRVYFQQKKYVESIRALQSSVKLCPKYAQPYYYMSMAYQRLSKKDDAIAACRRVITLSPDTTEAESCKQWVDLLKDGR